MTIYYVLDPLGKITSPDERKRYTRYIGQEAYAFITSEEGKKRHYVNVSNDDDLDQIWMEVEEKDYANELKIRDRERYIKLCRRDFKIECLPLDAVVNGDNQEEGLTWGEMVTDESANVEQEVSDLAKYELLYEALSCLTPEEHMLIKALYLNAQVMSMEDYAAQMGITRQAVYKQKMRILKKIKNYLEK